MEELHEKKRGMKVARCTVRLGDSTIALEFMEPKDFLELSFDSQGGIFSCLSHTLDEFALTTY